MPSETAVEILEYSYANDKPLYRKSLEAVAAARKVRRVFLEHQPRVERNVTLIATLSRPSLILISNSLLSAWLLKQHKAIITDFLDALKITHNEGMVEDLPSAPDDATLKTAVENLVTKYPPLVVAIYLHAFNDMNAAGWKNLEALLQDDARLQLKAEAKA